MGLIPAEEFVIVLIFYFLL